MELNAEQIKKALECCTRGRKSKEDRPCLNCLYNECNLVGGTSERQRTGTCQGWLMKDALALIISYEQRIGAQDMTISELRQRAEKAEHDADRYASRIEAYRQELGEVRVALAEANKDRQKLTEEKEMLIVTLKMNDAPFPEGLQIVHDFCQKNIKKAKVDTVRKMQEDLTSCFCPDCDYSGHDVRRVIDQIAKEMVEGGD